MLNMLGVNSHPLDILKLGFWNINGCNSKVIGNKLVTRDFRETIKSCNVIGLAETHIHSAIRQTFQVTRGRIS